MNVYCASINLKVGQFNSIENASTSNNNIQFDMGLASDPAPSPNIQLVAVDPTPTTPLSEIRIHGRQGDWAELTFILQDENNLLVGAYFFNAQGNIIGDREFPAVTLTASKDPQISTLTITDYLHNIQGVDAYNYSLLVQNNLNQPNLASGNPGAIGIIDPTITVEIDD